MHPIALVRKKAQALNQGRLLVIPAIDLVDTVLPHTRRGARLLERIGLERPALMLSSLLAELSAPAHKGVPQVLVDRLAHGLHAHLDHAPPARYVVDRALAPLRDKLEALRTSLALADPERPIDGRVARLTLEITPPAMFYAEGRGLDSVPSGLVLSLARVRTLDVPLVWSPVRGAIADIPSMRYATERALDIVLEPILDEEERLLAMLSSQRIVKLAHLGGGGLKIVLPDPAMAPELGLDGEDRDRHDARGDIPGTFVVFRPGRALDIIARLALRDDVTIAWSSADKTRTTKMRAQDLRVRAGVTKDWLGIEGGVAIDEHTAVSVAAILDALREGRRYVVVRDDGTNRLMAAITDELADALAPLAVAASPPALIALADAGVTVEGGAAFAAATDAHARAKLVDGTPPASFVGDLRPYQREGLRFLRRIVAWGTGGVLADDMGLGKTRIALALLTERAALGPQLVITPTSVLHAWKKETAACAPSLKLIAYAGAHRKTALAHAGPGDVVLASYGVIQRDVEALTLKRFATLILDEAQQVKNASALRSRGVRALDVEPGARIALTGTPLENHTGELWSVLTATSPGLFGSWAQFKSRFAQPIEKDHDARRKKMLARAIAPFLLRRTKAQVAPELPPKIEVERVLELLPVERRAYDDLRKALVVDLDQLDRDKDDRADAMPGHRRVKILAALTKLRLCACHPALASDVEVPWSDVEPGTKQRALVDLLLELKTAGHHALVFSQFVRHLRLARSACDKLGIITRELVGETPADTRAALVDEFQEGGVDAFFISLKAGGFGMTLTKATTVVHLDPWWNPAAEDQATDRAHRIGQHLPVTVVRLIAGGTLEEQILELHAHKRALVDAVLEGTDRAGTLGVDELMELVRTTRRSSRTADDGQEPALP